MTLNTPEFLNVASSKAGEIEKENNQELSAKVLDICSDL
jgi:hypothetical protein